MRWAQELRRSPRWPAIRAALIAFHVVAISVGSIPVLVDKRGMTEEAWSSSLVQAEFQKWSGTLSEAGWKMTPGEFEEFAWNFANRTLEAQSAMTAPFQPYYSIAGTRQRWRMFPAPATNPFSFRIEIREESWRTILEFGSEDQAWRRAIFDQDRMRAALNLYAWGVYPEAYDEFADWVSREVKKDFPEAEMVRISFPVLPTLSPAEATAGEVRKPLPPGEAERIRELPVGWNDQSVSRMLQLAR